MSAFEEEAKSIGTWLYGPDEGISEGLVRTLIDKIRVALEAAHAKGRKEGLKESTKIAETARDHISYTSDYSRTTNDSICQFVADKIRERIKP